MFYELICRYVVITHDNKILVCYNTVSLDCAINETDQCIAFIFSAFLKRELLLLYKIIICHNIQIFFN